MLLRFAPYIIAISMLGYLYYSYTSLQEDNEILKQNNKTLKTNNEKIVESYEYSIRILEKKAYEEGLNKAESKIANDLNKKIENLNKKRQFNETNDTTYRTTSF